MSMEATKSQAKVAKLHAELGKDTFDSWRTEHSSEVLTPYQAAAVNRASQENMDSYYSENPSNA